MLRQMKKETLMTPSGQKSESRLLRSRLLTLFGHQIGEKVRKGKMKKKRAKGQWKEIHRRSNTINHVCVNLLINLICRSAATRKKPVKGGADCKYQNIYLQWISVIYYTVHTLVFLWRRQWRVSGSQKKGISHQVLPVIFQAPLFGCRGLGPSVLRGTRGTLKHLWVLFSAPIPVCVCVCVFLLCVPPCPWTDG